MGIFSKRDVVQELTNGISIKDVREERPDFRRVYSTKLADRGTATIEIRTFIGNSRYASGELRQNDGRWVLFEPERVADKIIDPVLVPLVEQFAKQVFALDKAFMASDPSEFIDESGATWRKAKA